MKTLTKEAQGYGSEWRKIRTAFLELFTQCVLCGKKASVADHFPRSRKELVRAGIADPDAFELMRPLCRSCHSRETAKHQPGGWNQR